MTQQITKTHLFGEMDLNLDSTIEEIKKEIYKIGSLCGYMFAVKEDHILVYDNDYNQAKIFYANNKVTKVLKSEDDGKNWEELNHDEKRFKLTKQTLQNYNSKIEYGNEKTLPMSQGMAINTLIETYKIPAKQYGYYHNLLGIETNKQFLLWRDQGSHTEFLGIINKDGTDPK